MNIIAVKVKAILDEVLGQDGKLRKGGAEVSYFCPKCFHYKRKLECSLETFLFSCWVCHFSGHIYKLLKFYKASGKYYDQLRPYIGEIVRSYKFPIKDESVLSLPEDFVSLAESNHTIEYKHAMSYLNGRGVGMDDICRYNIGISPFFYKDCIVVPSYDSEGKLNYFSCRYYYPHTWFKYKNAPGSKNIVGFESFVNYEEPVTLVEGVFDAIAVRKNAVPLFGTMLPMKVKESLVLNKVKRVNLILDNDALSASLVAVQELWKWGVPVHLVELDKKDPSELGFERVQELIEASKPYNFESLIYHKLRI